MAYKIFELHRPTVLSRTEAVGYGQIETTAPITLLELRNRPFEMDYEYTSESEAKEDIIKHKEKFKYKNLVILDVISVNFEGEIS